MALLPMLMPKITVPRMCRCWHRMAMRYRLPVPSIISKSDLHLKSHPLRIVKISFVHVLSDNFAVSEAE